MKYLLYLSSAFLFIACYSDRSKDLPSLELYKRDLVGGKPGSQNWDYLVINNYKEGTMTFNEFSLLANGYIDSVRSKNGVAGVTFLRKKSCCNLPPPGYNNDISPFELISFGYLQIGNTDSIELFTCSYWENGKKMVYINKVLEDRIRIDSLLKSKIPYYY